MQWFLPSKRPAAAAALGELQRAVDKLRGYHELAQEAAERAYAKEREGQREAAARLYTTVLSILQEGLAVAVPTAGLEAAHSNTSRWRSDLACWQQLVQARLRQLEHGAITGQPLGHPLHATLPPTGLQPSISSNSRPAASAAGGRPLAEGVARPAAAPQWQAAGQGGGSREEQQFEERILSEVLDSASSVAWADVAGLAAAKQALQEMVILPSLRADLFQGLRAPARGLLLYGPPGTGKTMLARALAHEARALFFNISAASLTSRWHGDAEKLVRALFRVAARNQPSIIFIDEIDSILSERSSAEHEASRRLKTEFLVQLDGVSSSSSDRVVVIGATNRPWELDDAVRRRLAKRIYVPLPDAEARRGIVLRLLQGLRHRLGRGELERIVVATEGYSGSDLAALCKEAALLPLRELGPAVASISADAVRPIAAADFAAAARAIKPSVSPQQLQRFQEWTRQYGMAA